MESQTRRAAWRQYRTFSDSFKEEAICKLKQEYHKYVVCKFFQQSAEWVLTLSTVCLCCAVLGDFLEVYTRRSRGGLGKLSDVSDYDCKTMKIFHWLHLKHRHHLCHLKELSLVSPGLFGHFIWSVFYIEDMGTYSMQRYSTSAWTWTYVCEFWH